MIPCQRHLFDIPADVAYLNCAYVSPLMWSVRDAGVRGVERKMRPWTLFAEDFFTEADEARGLFARLIGATADDVAIVPAASYGTATAASNIGVSRGQRLVVVGEEQASNVYPWRELARARGGELVTVPRPADEDWTAALLGAIDERVAVVAAPNCHWTDGGLIDVVSIGRRCRAVGAALVLDVTQSCGALPIDVTQAQPDFLVSATYKWLLGPYSLGFLYVAPHRQTGRPIEHNAFQHSREPRFGGPVTYPDEYAVGARRFDMGERANFATMPMAIAAMKQILGWGVSAIAETLAVRTADIAARAAALGLFTVPRPLRAGHYIGIRHTDAVPVELTERLAKNKVMVSVRGGRTLRVTPHLWNTDADVDRLFEVLALPTDPLPHRA